MQGWKENGHGKTRRAKPAEPVALDDFLFALRISDAAASGKMATSNPQNRKIFLEDTGETIALTDLPLNRGMLAVVDQFRDRTHEYCMALMWRLMLIGQVANDRTFAPWFRENEVAGTLLEAVATFPTNLGRAFNRRALLTAVKRIENQNTDK